MPSSRRNISQPVELWVALREQMTREQADNMSAWVGECIVANLDPDLRATLPTRPTAGRPTTKESK